MAQRELLLRWVGPSAVVLVVLVLYTWLIGPTLSDLRDDWAFLHAARIQAIQQQLRQQQSQKPPEGP